MSLRRPRDERASPEATRPRVCATRSGRARRWALRLEQSESTFPLLFVLSLLETLIVPIPIEVVLIPLMAGRRNRVWRIAGVTTLGCLAGALLGYAVGRLLYPSAGQWLLPAVHDPAQYLAFQELFHRHGFVAILLVGILPIPFQLAMLTAGLAGYPLGLFLLAAILARGVRYFGLAWLVVRFGRSAVDLWKRHALATSLIAGSLLAALYAVGQTLTDAIL